MESYLNIISSFIFLSLGPVTFTRSELLPDCQGSPVDFVPSLVKGRSTFSLTSSIVNLSVSVEMKYLQRNGISVLTLTPVLNDETKCVDYPTGDVKLCYEFSEVHWGRTEEEGSDHSIGGYNYPMEVQHYFHRTNSSHSMMPLALGVLFKQMSNKNTTESPSDKTTEKPFTGVHEMYPHYLEDGERLKLNLAWLLPSQPADKPFYHYRGPVTGQCGPDRDWIVFEEPLEVYPSFMNFLRSLNDLDEYNHYFQTVSRNECYLYSHYSEGTAGEDCGFNEMITKERITSGSTLDSVMTKIKIIHHSVTENASELHSQFPGPWAVKVAEVSTEEIEFSSLQLTRSALIHSTESEPYSQAIEALTTEELTNVESTVLADIMISSKWHYDIEPSLLTSTIPTHDILHTKSLEETLHASENFIYATPVAEDPSETAVSEGKPSESSSKQEVTEKPLDNKSSKSSSASLLPLFMIMIWILFW